MNENFRPLPIKNKKTEAKPEPQPYEVSGLTIYIPFQLSEKLKDFSYWEGDNQKDVVIQALNQFFEGKEVKPRPEKVRNKKKPGKKSIAA